jgi:hypothetical protein
VDWELVLRRNPYWVSKVEIGESKLVIIVFGRVEVELGYSEGWQLNDLIVLLGLSIKTHLQRSNDVVFVSIDYVYLCFFPFPRITLPNIYFLSLANALQINKAVIFPFLMFFYFIFVFIVLRPLLTNIGISLHFDDGLNWFDSMYAITLLISDGGSTQGTLIGNDETALNALKAEDVIALGRNWEQDKLSAYWANEIFTAILNELNKFFIKKYILSLML